MPRKSVEALTTFPRVDGRVSHLETPADLPASLRPIVDDLVASQRPEHFRPGDEHLLEQYAQAITVGRKAFAKLEKEGYVVGGKANPWIIILEKAHRSVVALSGRLRLAPQMRERSRTVGRNGPEGYTRPLWMDDGDTA
jgi:phage terminase small subunit